MPRRVLPRILPGLSRAGGANGGRGLPGRSGLQGATVPPPARVASLRRRPREALETAAALRKYPFSSCVRAPPCPALFVWDAVSSSLQLCGVGSISIVQMGKLRPRARSWASHGGRAAGGCVGMGPRTPCACHHGASGPCARQPLWSGHFERTSSSFSHKAKSDDRAGADVCPLVTRSQLPREDDCLENGDPGEWALRVPSVCLREKTDISVFLRWAHSRCLINRSCGGSRGQRGSGKTPGVDPWISGALQLRSFT
nr:uncharacterized protein LOC120366014 [Saimiri boliviensis boliviensis]